MLDFLSELHTNEDVILNSKLLIVNYIDYQYLE